MQVGVETPVRKSGSVQIVRGSDSAVIWHSLFGRPKLVSLSTLFFLDLFNEPRSLGWVLSEYDFGEGQLAIEELCGDYYLVPEGFDERALLEAKAQEHAKMIPTGSLVKFLSLVVSEACNFRCRYCMHFNNRQTSGCLERSRQVMSAEVAKEAVDWFLSVLREHERTISEINFGGGEPLLAWPVIEEILHYCETVYGGEFALKFSLNTNASLITTEIAEKLKAHQVAIASSLDGLSDGNDRVRLTTAGDGTFELIINGFDQLAATGYPLGGFAVAVTEDNFPYLDERVIDWAAERGMPDVRIDVDVVGMVEVSLDDIVQKLLCLRQYARERGIDVVGFWSRPVENLNDSALDTHIAFCGGVGGNSLCVSPAGGIYCCGYSTAQLGTLDQEADSFFASGSPYYNLVQSRLIGSMGACQGCTIEGQCGGGCEITREFSSSTGSSKIQRMCEFYRRMTQELLLEQLSELG